MKKLSIILFCLSFIALLYSFIFWHEMVFSFPENIPSYHNFYKFNDISTYEGYACVGDRLYETPPPIIFRYSVNLKNGVITKEINSKK